MFSGLASPPAAGAAGASSCGLPSPLRKASTFSLLTTATPVLTKASTASPFAALAAVSVPSSPILPGNCATEPLSSPAWIDFSASGEASKPTITSVLPAALAAFSAPSAISSLVA